MTATLTLDTEGRITLPDAVKRALGIQPGTPLRAEVSYDRLELVTDACGNVPEITELTEEGSLRLPPGVRVTTRQIVEAINTGREQRIRKLAGH